MPALKVAVAPDVLVWARESIGLSQEEAASRLNMSSMDLRYLEEGAEDVTMPRIRQMADVYKRPQIVFFLPSPPDLQDFMPDFRTTPRQHSRPWSPELHSEYRRVVSQRNAVLEVSEFDEDPPEPIRLTLIGTEDPETAGAAVRQWLRAPDVFEDANDHREIFNEWVELVERHPILVVQVSGIEIAEMRGFSLGDVPWPAIAINNRDVFTARTFTLLHELVHVLLRHDGVCD